MVILWLILWLSSIECINFVILLAYEENVSINVVLRIFVR